MKAARRHSGRGRGAASPLGSAFRVGSVFEGLEPRLLLNATAGYWRGDLQVEVNSVSRPTQVITLNVNAGSSLIRFSDADLGVGVLEEGGAFGSAALDWTGPPGHPNEADCQSDPFGLITSGTINDWDVNGQDSDSVIRSTFRGSFEPDASRAEGTFQATLTIPTCDDAPVPEESQASGTWKMRGDWISDILPTRFEWGPEGEIDVAFDISGHRLPKPTRTEVYWAKGPNERDALQPIIGWETGITQGTVENVITKSELTAPPSQATHLLVVVDPTDRNPIAEITLPDGLIRESTEDNNQLAIPLPNIVGGSATIDQNVLNFSYEVLGPALQVQPEIEFWWSDSTSFADRLERIDVVSENGNRVLPFGGVDSVQLNDLPVARPLGATHLLIVLDPADPDDASDYGTAVEAKHLDYADNVIAVEMQQPPVGLVVTSLTPQNSGFVAKFNSELNPDSLNLYGERPSDITLQGTTVGTVRGSAVLADDRRTVTFVKTGGPLVPDTYTVELNSGPDGFKTPDDVLLDGDGNGTGGDNFRGTFSVAGTARPAGFSIPDFVRGAGQGVQVPADGVGLPVRMTSGSGIRHAELTVTYDPALLTVSDVLPGPHLADQGTLSVDLSAAGTASIRVSAPSDFPPGANVLVSLVAHVPQRALASARRQQVIRLAGTVASSPDSEPLQAGADEAVHLVSFFGDVSGNGQINATDASQLATAATLAAPFFEATPLTDPNLVGDLSGNGRLNALDAALLARFAAQLPTPLIPPLPTSASSVGTGGGGVSPSNGTARPEPSPTPPAAFPRPTRVLNSQRPRREEVARLGIEHTVVDAALNELLEGRVAGEDVFAMRPAF